MPRKQTLPAREVEICKRFESFRRGSKIPRTVFARAIGFSPERIASYENAVAPIRYEFFREVHRLFPISPHWLVTGEGSPLAGGSFDDTPFRGQFREEELLSVVYDRLLTDHFRSVEHEAAESIFAPDGADARVEKVIYALADPKTKKLYSKEFQERFWCFLADALEKLNVINGHPSPLYPNGVKSRPQTRGMPGWPE